MELLKFNTNKAIQIKNFFNKNKKFYFKEKINSIIPLNLYVYWHTKELPPLIKKNYETLVKMHPRFKHFLYDDANARNFIKDNFEHSVLNAYDNLIPPAFKCDLFRYCVLYINGGIYLDIKYQTQNGFRLIALTEQEYFVKDLDESGAGIYNALLICLPKNNILLNAINKIVKNVENKYYGSDGLYPTGPMMLKSFFPKNIINNMKLKHTMNNINNKKIYCIEYNNQIIMKIFDEYRDEQKKYVKHHHSENWNNRNIYKQL